MGAGAHGGGTIPGIARAADRVATAGGQPRSQKGGSMRRTTRLLAAIVACTALLGAATAIAGTKTYTGGFKHGGTLSLKAHLKNGTPTAVFGYHWKNVPLDCDQGTVPYGGNLAGRVVVARRHFKTSIHSTDNKAKGTFAGHFIKHGKQAKGYFKVDGDIKADNGSTLTNCHTGTARFKIK
jgi:hypothetical protein